MNDEDRYLVVDIRAPHDPEAGIFRGQEAARILREIADQLEQGDFAPTARRVRDVNGNSCGQWIIQSAEDDGTVHELISVGLPASVAVRASALRDVAAAAQRYVSETWPQEAP